MALGSGTNYSQKSSQTQNNHQSLYEPTYYSRLRIKNPVDNLSLSFSFWKGTLKVSISDTSSDGKTNELSYIHLSPTKAKMMVEAIDRVINNPTASDIFGVDTGTGDIRGFIAIGRDKEVPFLFIAKVNTNGSYESAQRFNFNTNYNYLLNVKDISKLKCQKEYMNSIELTQFKEILADYSRFASGAIGASFYDIGRYESAKTSNLMRKIAEKIGVQVGSGNSNLNTGNSFFNSAEEVYSPPSGGRVSSNMSTKSYTSIEDLENELG